MHYSVRRFAFFLVLGAALFAASERAAAQPPPKGLSIPDSSGSAPTHAAPARASGDLKRILDNPGEALSKEGKRLLEELRKEKPQIAPKAERVLGDYERAIEALRRFVRDNVEGKRIEDLGREALDELRRRSREVRDLEASLNELLRDNDVASLVQRLRTNPREFLTQEAEALLQRIRDRDPQTAKEFERLLGDYRRQLQELEKQLRERVHGKRPEEISRETWNEIRTRSESLRNLESRLQGVINDAEAIRRIVEQELRNRNIPAQLNAAWGDFQRLHTTELRNLERQIGVELDRLRRNVEGDIRRIIERKR